MKLFKILAFTFFSLTFFIQATSPEWGFFGHRKVNRMAVFTLPQEVIGFYKKNIEFITEHAVDPDKRRYATKHEAVRHYIDIDHWDVYPFEKVPRDLHEAFLSYATVSVISENKDTLNFAMATCRTASDSENLVFDCDFEYKAFYDEIFPSYYDDEISCSCEFVKEYLTAASLEKIGDCKKLVFVDHFREYGVLPYWLPQIYNNLIKAMANHDKQRILRLSAEIGHYIGDAHVPLHTTENYNGQLTDQVGIHAFWESRLPELFANEEYDFMVGKAEYIKNPKEYFWKMVMDSHAHLDEVLDFEKRLSENYPQDEQFCFDERNERTIKTQCKAYAEAYHTEMDGMVEERMKSAVHALGSVWYSAWIDAGQPDLEMDEVSWDEAELEKQKELESKFKKGSIKGRDHGNEE